MSQRLAKVESVVQQVVAGALLEELPDLSARLTVKAVDVSPDMRNATVWVAILEDETERAKSFERVAGVRPSAQVRLAQKMTTKFVPRIHFRLDNSGDYVDHINDLIKKI